MNTGSSQEMVSATKDMEPEAMESEAEAIAIAEMESEKLSPVLERMSVMVHLAAFGIVGVLIRYGLVKLFGPSTGDVTAESSSLFMTLPPNMLGSFFMGWVGFVLKNEIILYSEPLAVGLSTGLMGSITTFSSWVQSILVLITSRYWLRALCGVLIGTEVSLMSFTIGADSAYLVLWFLKKHEDDKNSKILHHHWFRNFSGLVIFSFIATVLWLAALVLFLKDTESLERRKLWLGCVVAPPGVWIRWLLARLNGSSVRGLQWLPIGTLFANIFACILSFVLAIIDLAVNRSNASLIIGGIQLGFLGCLSTVSTFVFEIHVLHKTNKKWSSYGYCFITFFLAVAFGIVIYSSIVWAKGWSVL